LNELRQLIRVAAPLALVQLGSQLMGVVDTAFAGRLGKVSLAATGVGSSVFFGVSVVGMGVALALDPLTAQAFGAGESARARRILWQGFWAAGIVTVPLSLVVVALSWQLETFGVATELAAETRRYVYARLPQLFLLLMTVALRSYLQAAHLTRAVLWSTVAANVVNVSGNWLLGFGEPYLGVPRLGVAGLGLATTFATAAQVVVLGVAVRRVDAGTPERRPSRALLGQIFRVGVPIGLHLLAEVGIFATVQVLMARMSELASASHQVALMLASLTFSICLGIGAATSVEVGRAIGKGDAQATRRAGIAGMSVAASFMFLMAVVMWTIPGSLARLLSDDAEVIEAATVLLRIAGAFQIADGVQAVASGALRGAGVTRWSFVANLIAYWAIGMPVGVALASWAGLGPAGLWWGLTSGLAAAAVALAAKFVTLSRRPIQRLTAA
jgi:multidrug resistance protein, MATE family